MRASFVDWKSWKAVQIVSGDCEMIIGISAGPRIVALSYKGGSNLLYEDATNFGVGDWRLYGGHRFTTAPENDASYYPDNSLCQVVLGDDNVRVTAPVRPDDLQLSMEICKTGVGFTIVHTLDNGGAKDWTGALWAITCIPRSAEIQALSATDAVHYWPGTDPQNWLFSGEYMTVTPGDHRGKVGWHQHKGRLAAKQPEGKLTICNNEETLPNDCVDGGCNHEVFACNYWLELETLSQQYTVAPGRFVRHSQQWIIEE